VSLAKALLFVVGLAAQMPAAAQSLETVKEREKFDEVFELIDKAELALKSASRVRRSDCLKAVGDQSFCTCIDNKLAVAWSFADYVAITTRSKEENRYDQLDPKLQPAYDSVPAARDECVASRVAP
jgi:hypothetical protein